MKTLLKSLMIMGACLLATGLFGGVALAQTIGNPLVSTGGYLDTCRGCTYVLDTPFTAPGKLTEWSFYSEPNIYGLPVIGNYVTPLLFKDNGDGSVTLVGIGQSIYVSADGPQTHDFVVYQGTNLVDAATYFGYRDGKIDVLGVFTANTGSISFSDGLIWLQLT